MSFRWNIGVIAEDAVERTLRGDAGADHAEPGPGDLLLEIAVVPGEAGSLDKAARRVEGRHAG
jgi:hypothetical protein